MAGSVGTQIRHSRQSCRPLRSFFKFPNRVDVETLPTGRSGSLHDPPLLEK
jgi:hypothetical protein